MQHLQEFIKNAGGWADIGIFPDKGWDINDDLANHHYNGSSAFFIREIVPDDHNSSKPIIVVITSVIIILYAFFSYLYEKSPSFVHKNIPLMTQAKIRTL